MDGGAAPEAHAALLAGDRESFNREIHLAGLFDPRANAMLRRRGRWYGLDGRTPFDVYSRVREFRLGDELERITTRCSFARTRKSGATRPGARALRTPARHAAPLSAGDPFDWLDRTLTRKGTP